MPTRKEISDRVAAPRLYVIAARASCGGRSLVEVVAQAVAGAAPFRASNGSSPLAICLREKALDGVTLLRLARELTLVTRTAGVPLYINGRADIACLADAQGVHLPVDGMAIADVHAWAPGLLAARSTHNAAEIASAQDEGAAFVVFGPVFDTPSKAGLLSSQGLDGLAKAVLQGHGLPILALGGITLNNAADCFRAGAHGIACMRAITSAENPALVTAAFLAQLENQI